MTQDANVLDICGSPRAAFDMDTLKEQIPRLNLYNETMNHEGALATVNAMLALVKSNITATSLERSLARAMNGDINYSLMEIEMMLRHRPTLVDAYIYAIRIACLYDLRKAWLYYLQGKDKLPRDVPEWDAFTRVGNALSARIATRNGWKLPYDVIATIIELLSLKDRINFSRTCTYWKDFIFTCPQAWKRLDLHTNAAVKGCTWLKKHSTAMQPYMRHICVRDKEALFEFVLDLNHLEVLELGNIGVEFWAPNSISDFFKTRQQRQRKQLKAIKTSATRITHGSLSSILTYNPELVSVNAVIGSSLKHTSRPSVAIQTTTTLYLRQLTILDAHPSTQGLASILERSPNLESLIYTTMSSYPKRTQVSTSTHFECEHIASIVNKHCPKLKNLCYWREYEWLKNTFETAIKEGENCLAYYDLSDTHPEEHLLDFAKRRQDTLETIAIDLNYTHPTSDFVHFLLHTTLPQLTSLCIRGCFEQTPSSTASRSHNYISYQKVTNMIERHSKLRHLRLETVCDLEKPVLQAISQLTQLEELALGFFHVSLVDRMDDLSELLSKTQATLKRFYLHTGISNLATRHIFHLVDKYDQLTHLTCATDLNLTLDGITDFVRKGSSTFSPLKLSRQLINLTLLAPSGNLDFMAFEPLCDLGLLPKLKHLEIIHMAGQRLSGTTMDALVASRHELTARVISGSQVYDYPSPSYSQ
ncbi:hypothetical protein K492DRAFT_190238 [Lichtheimia hyalospora FSU 10163]|nr:hypothetical protein K492DRAFT_190238 [Lichtheimia hyalospora FSU 10163]